MLPVVQAQEMGDSGSLFVYREISFESHFPDGVTSTLTVTTQKKLEQVAFFMTMDEVVIYRNEVQIPRHQPDSSLTLYGEWNGVSVTGEISPPWTTVKTWWQLIDEAGNSIVTRPVQHLYSATGARHWDSVAGDDVTVYGYGQSRQFLQDAVRMADNAMQQLAQSYGYDLPYHPVIVFYNSAAEGDADLSPLTHSAFGTYFGGRAYPGTGGVVALATENLANVIPHELAHLFQFQLGGLFFDAPPWWREGDAKSHETKTSVEAGLIRARELASEMPDLSSWYELPEGKAKVNDMMNTGLSFVFFLQERYGEASHAAFYKNWRQSRDFFLSFEMTYGQTLNGLDAKWRIWLQLHGKPD